MIGKITKGTRAGSIGAYLHGAGKANEHEYTNAAGERKAGGVVIGSNLPVLGHTDPKKWAQLMRHPLALRDREVKQPIWQVSLALPPGEKLTPRQWSEAAQVFVERLGVAEHPWVAVHHGSSKGGNDHIHIVLNRVNFEGELWAAKHDYREVQRAATHLEQRYGLSSAPRTRSISSPKRTSKAEVIAGQRESTTEIGKTREQHARLMRVRSVAGIAQAKPAREAAAQKPNLGRSRPRRGNGITPDRGKDLGR